MRFLQLYSYRKRRNKLNSPIKYYFAIIKNNKENDFLNTDSIPCNIVRKCDKCIEKQQRKWYIDAIKKKTVSITGSSP